MLRVDIPREITDYTEKFMFGLSLRQLICLSLGILAAIGVYILTSQVIGLPTDICGYLIVFTIMPFAAVGFLKRHGMPFEKYFAIMQRYRASQKKRPYVASEQSSNDFLIHYAEGSKKGAKAKGKRGKT